MHNIITNMKKIHFATFVVEVLQVLIVLEEEHLYFSLIKLLMCFKFKLYFRRKLNKVQAYKYISKANTIREAKRATKIDCFKYDG